VQRKSPPIWDVAPPPHRTRRAAAICVTFLFFVGIAQCALGQQDDPSEIFLKAYLSAQQGEKLEHENRFNTALAKYRFAGSLIETLRRSHADWQPAVVEYRGRKISERILRVQERMTKQNALTASAAALPEIVPALPDGAGWSEPGSDVVTPQLDETVQTSRYSATKTSTKTLRDKIDQLQAAVGKTRGELEAARTQKQTVDTRLRETNSKLEKAQNDVEKAKNSEQQVRDELAKAHETFQASQVLQEKSTKERQQLQADVGHLKDALAAADEARLTAAKQRDDVQAKLVVANGQVTALEHQRDDAFAQLKAAKEIEQGMQLLLAEKEDLQRKLTAAERTVRGLGEKDPVNAQTFGDMNQQLAELRQQLVESEKRNDYLAARAAELGVQLDEAGTELQTVKLKGTNSEESEQLTRENELLRNIVVRERQVEARRDQARKLVITELSKLRIRSDALSRQIEFLAQPVTTLNTEELALLRQPVVSVSDQQAGLFRASFVFEKKSAGHSISTAPAGTTATSGAPSHARRNNHDPGKTDVPPKLQGLARAAKKNVQQRNFEAAEKQYQQILAADPNNIDALSSLGIMYYRSGKLPAAESALKKAVTSAPDNDFLLTTLGVIHYRQSKFDDAIIELRKAIAINSNSATAHNYLGIAASQKGRQQEAEQEILQALANNPDDPDAHFNLAVILATTQPGSKELARQHYARATALGTQPSPSLEKLLR